MPLTGARALPLGLAMSVASGVVGTKSQFGARPKGSVADALVPETASTRSAQRATSHIAGGFCRLGHSTVGTPGREKATKMILGN